MTHPVNTSSILAIALSLTLTAAAQAEPADVTGVLRDGFLQVDAEPPQVSLYQLSRTQQRQLRGLEGKRLRLVGETLPKQRWKVLERGGRKVPHVVQRLVVKQVHLRPSRTRQRPAPQPVDRIQEGAAQRLEDAGEAPANDGGGSPVHNFLGAAQTLLEDGLTEVEFQLLDETFDRLSAADRVEVGDALIRKGGDWRALSSALRYGGWSYYEAHTKTRAGDTITPAQPPTTAEPTAHAPGNPGTPSSGPQLLSGGRVAKEIWKAVKDMDAELREAAKQLLESIYGYMEGVSAHGRRYAFMHPGLSEGEFLAIKSSLQHYRTGTPGDQVVYTRVYNWLVGGGPKGSSYAHSYRVLCQVVRAKGEQAAYTHYTDLRGAQGK